MAPSSTDADSTPAPPDGEACCRGDHQLTDDELDLSDYVASATIEAEKPTE